MTCSIGDLHCSIYNILSQDAQITALATGVFNYIPQDGTLYPYITIGRVSSTALFNFDDDGESFIYYVDIYGKNKSMIDLYTLAKRIKELLSKKEDDISTPECCVDYIVFAGYDENPIVDMETQGRQLSLQFNIKFF